MADGLPGLSDFCISLSLGPGELCIQFPGGVKLCAQAGFDTGDASTIVRSLLAQVNSALMPLQPFFMVLDAIKAIVDCVQAVPEAIIQLDPSGMIECIPDMVKKLTKLLQLLPQLSIPVLIKQLLEALVVQLIALRGQIAALIAHQARLIAAGLRAAELGNVELQTVVDCALENVLAQLANNNAAMAPLNRLIGTINVLLELAGLQPIEVLPSMGDEVSDEVLTVLDGAIDVLQVAADAIPV